MEFGTTISKGGEGQLVYLTLSKCGKVLRAVSDSEQLWEGLWRATYLVMRRCGKCTIAGGKRTDVDQPWEAPASEGKYGSGGIVQS